MKHSSVFIFLVITAFSIMGMKIRQPGIRFSHKVHSQDVGVGCGDCHAATDSKSPSDNLLPGHDNCYICHEEGDTECSYCHTNADDPDGVPDITTYIAKFPHAKHVGDDMQCATCHAGVESSDIVAEQHLPSMQSCQICHDEMEAINYCQQCHVAGENLTPMDHQMDWSQVHGVVSHLDEENCAMCHTEKQCFDCHAGDNQDRAIHPLNYVNNHAIDARNKRDNCYTCHEELESCVTCHREQLVMPLNHNTAGWSNFGNGGRHARLAKIDLDNCLACHNDNYGEPVCAQCHVAE